MTVNHYRVSGHTKEANAHVIAFFEANGIEAKWVTRDQYIKVDTEAMTVRFNQFVGVDGRKVVLQPEPGINEHSIARTAVTAPITRMPEEFHLELVPFDQTGQPEDFLPRAFEALTNQVERLARAVYNAAGAKPE